jgi:hypothetical protein
MYILHQHLIHWWLEFELESDLLMYQLQFQHMEQLDPEFDLVAVMRKL